MSMTDPLGDMLTRIRNAAMRGKGNVKTPASRTRVISVVIHGQILKAVSPNLKSNSSITKAVRSFVKSSGSRSRAAGCIHR